MSHVRTFSYSGEERVESRKRTIVFVVTHSWNMGHVPNIHFFPRKKAKSQPTLLLSTFFRCFDGFILLCQTQEKIPMKLANQFSLMPICNFTVAVANHSCYSRRVVRIVWQRDELVMWFETAFAMICMDYHLFICRRESTFAFSFGSFSWVDQKR